MTNYQDDDGSRIAGAGAPPAGYQGSPTGGAYQDGSQQGTSQFPAADQQGYQAYQGGPGGQAHHSGPGLLQGAHNPMSSRAVRHVNVRSTFKTTEFWVLVVVSVALLIAAAVTDIDDGQGFGALDAWKYVTWLSIAYILSRGLTKFSGHDRGDDHHDHGHDRH